MKKYLHIFVACLATLAIVVLIIFSIGSATELNKAKQGAQEGFEISGTYMKTRSTDYYISFIENQANKDQIIWQYQEYDSINASGYIDEALGPNVYALFSHDGEKVGWVNLAYTNNKDEASLFIKYGDGEVTEFTVFIDNPMIKDISPSQKIHED